MDPSARLQVVTGDADKQEVSWELGGYQPLGQLGWNGSQGSYKAYPRDLIGFKKDTSWYLQKPVRKENMNKPCCS